MIALRQWHFVYKMPGRLIAAPTIPIGKLLDLLPVGVLFQNDDHPTIPPFQRSYRVKQKGLTAAAP